MSTTSTPTRGACRSPAWASVYGLVHGAIARHLVLDTSSSLYTHRRGVPIWHAHARRGVPSIVSSRVVRIAMSVACIVARVVVREPIMV